MSAMISIEPPSSWDNKGVVYFALLNLKSLYQYLAAETLLDGREQSICHHKINQLDNLVRSLEERSEVEDTFCKKWHSIGIQFPFNHNRAAFYCSLLTKKDDLASDERALLPYIEHIYHLVRLMVESNISFDSETGHQLARLSEHLLSITPPRKYFDCDGNSTVAPYFFFPAFSMPLERCALIIEAGKFMLFPYSKDIQLSEPYRRFAELGESWLHGRMEFDDLILLQNEVEWYSEMMKNVVSELPRVGE